MFRRTRKEQYSSEPLASVQKCEWKSLEEEKEMSELLIIIQQPPSWNSQLRFHQRPQGSSVRGGGTDLRLFGVHGGDEALQTERVQRLSAADVHGGRLQEHGQSCEQTGLIHSVLSCTQQTSQPPVGPACGCCGKRPCRWFLPGSQRPSRVLRADLSRSLQAPRLFS